MENEQEVTTETTDKASAPVTDTANPTGAAPSTEGAAPAAGAPKVIGQAPEAAADPEYEVPVNGQKVKVKLSELQAGYSRDQDYRRKTQQLAEEKRRLIASYNEAVKKLQQPPKPGQEPEQRNEALERVTKLEQQIADNKFEATLRDLKSRYPDLNEKLFCLAVAEKGTQDWDELEEIAKEQVASAGSERDSLIEKLLSEGKHPKVLSYRQSVIDAYLKEKEKESKAKGEIGGAGAPGGAAKPAQKITNLNDADKAALALLGNLPS